MSPINIFLILISGLGVLHGVFLAVLLWAYSKNNETSNKLLSLLLLVLSFRVGKSVFLEFAEDLYIQFIFIGLATLMAIGPLFYLFIKSLINTSFRFKKKYFIHFIPTFFGLFFGALMNNDLVASFPKMILVMMFGIYYGHYLVYLIASYRLIFKEKKKGLDADSYSFLMLLFYALLAIWMVYVLNLFDEIIPYIIGPILYTLVAYPISFVVFKKGYIKTANHEKYKTTFVSDEQIDLIFSRLIKLVIEEKQYKNGDLTLKSLGEQLNVTTQTLSMVINKKNKTNFNSFINYYRIEEAIKMFENKQYKNHTIASISFEAGFNSISSFNAAFKQKTKSTPMVFRKRLSE